MENPVRVVLDRSTSESVMNISDLLSPDRILVDAGIKSKKRLLEQLGELLMQGEEGLADGQVFNSLLARERLGGTGLGHGVALPHGRLSGLQHTLAAFVRPREGVDFDAPDNQPVDLVFALAVPEHAVDEHLNLLADLAGLCREPEQRQALRDAGSAEEIIAVVRRWEEGR
jgi:PTS system nitrogen regulatory IIA component